MTSKCITTIDIWSILKTIEDPELPSITIVELGIVRDVIINDGKYDITITPTYSGCPAMYWIEKTIHSAMIEHNIGNYTIKKVLSPPWTTEWMLESAKEKLKKMEITPPRSKNSPIPCPICNSNNTRMKSFFSSTPCRALYQCKECLENFDYFKCF